MHQDIKSNKFIPKLLDAKSGSYAMYLSKLKFMLIAEPVALRKLFPSDCMILIDKRVCFSFMNTFFHNCILKSIVSMECWHSWVILPGLISSPRYKGHVKAEHMLKIMETCVVYLLLIMNTIQRNNKQLWWVTWTCLLHYAVSIYIHPCFHFVVHVYHCHIKASCRKNKWRIGTAGP